MAFFKFRLPGQAALSPASAEAIAPGLGESIEIMRRRARHRLIGSVVLVLVAVLGFPLMFDTQPRRVSADTPILIPDKQNGSPSKVTKAPTPDSAPARPLQPETKPLAATEGLDANEEQVPVAKPVVAARPQAPAESLTQPVESQTKVPAVKAEVKAPVSKPDKTNTESAAKPKDDGNKARALLDGKPPTAAGERHVVQVGAFSDPAKVREVRRVLEQAGFTTFTQVVTATDGMPTTRVRVGPFGSREEAEKTAARIRKLDFSPAILRL